MTDESLPSGVLKVAEEAKEHLNAAIDAARHGLAAITRREQTRLCEERIDQLAALASPHPQATGALSEPVMWQSRFFDSTSSVTPGWGKWEEVVPRNAYTDTVETKVRELREYIAAGYKYELRALCVCAASQVEPEDDPDNDLTAYERWHGI